MVIYRKYYGTGPALRLAGVLYLASVVAGYVVELVFSALQHVPDQRSAVVGSGGVSWNYTSVLDIAFVVLAVVLVVRFLRTGGREMLSMMGGSPGSSDDTARGHHA